MPSGKRSKPFDAAQYLGSDEEIAEYLNEALLTADIDVITRAIGVAAKARGMTEVARQTGLSRESLYKALSGDVHPQFETIALVLQALGLQLRVEPATKIKSRLGYRFLTVLEDFGLSAPTLESL
ncbi:MAG: putative addiction module antidote protein [Rhodospirillales bacterium]|nr:putative addiction module antidote protein [Rhodospirillales bacterium]